MAKIVFKGNPEKSLETILYIASKKSGLGHYHVMKLIFFADYIHLNRYGRPITYDKLCAMEYGPVPSCAYNYYRTEKNEKASSGLPFVTRLDGRSQIITEIKRRPNEEVFSETDIEVLDEVIDKYGDKSFEELFQITHAMKAYKKAWKSRPKGKLMNSICYEDLIPRFRGRAQFIKELSEVCRYMG